jgi:hypothetical protein
MIYAMIKTRLWRMILRELARRVLNRSGSGTKNKSQKMKGINFMSRIKNSIDNSDWNQGQRIKNRISSHDSGLHKFGRRIKQSLVERVHDTRDLASNCYQQTRQKTVQAEKDVERYIRKQPVTSIFVAAGVGALLGIFWRRS